MGTQSDKKRPPLALIIGIAVILFSAAGTAAITNWSPAPSGGSSAFLALDDVPATAAKAVTLTEPKCAECGVILSMREINTQTDITGVGTANAAAPGNSDEKQSHQPRNYEFTIRMADRSLRLINDENSAIWRLGERVIVIDSSGLPAL
jgi:hypothetical protein